MIQYEGVTRTFGSKVAVAELDLTVHGGELLALLGPNGAGKTTTIKMTVGLLRPSAGRVLVCGHDVAVDTREATSRIGYVPDQPYLYDKLSGREILEFIAQIRGLDKHFTQRSIDEQIDTFELHDFIDDPSDSYSHGMKQRVVFATTMMHKPEVLIVDEPMVGLDPKSARLVKNLLRSRADAGTSVFMSTHTLNVVEEIADRVGIFKHGELIFLGTLSELKSRMPDRTLEEIYLEMTAVVGDGAEAT